MKCIIGFAVLMLAACGGRQSVHSYPYLNEQGLRSYYIVCDKRQECLQEMGRVCPQGYRLLEEDDKAKKKRRHDVAIVCATTSQPQNLVPDQSYDTGDKYRKEVE